MNVSALGQHAAIQVLNAAEPVVAERAPRTGDGLRAVSVGVSASPSGDDEELKGIDPAALERALSGNEPLDRLLDRAFKSEGLVAPEMPASEA